MAGKLLPGDALPSVRELASRYNCDPGTATRAGRTLLSRGIVERVGSATATRLILCPPKRQVLTDTIAVISTHRAGALPTEPGWSVHEFAGAMQMAAARGHGVLTLAPEQVTDDLIQQWRTNGLIGIVAIGEDLGPAVPALRRACTFGVPIAARSEDLNGVPCDRADSDHEAGGYLLAAHLIAQGRRRLATAWPWSHSISPDGYSWSRARQAGIARACHEASLPAPQRCAWVGPANREEAIRLGIKQLEKVITGPTPIDALLVHSDGDVPWMIEVVRRLGGSVHDGIAVTGYDHYWRPEFGDPPCLSIDKENAAVGAALIELVLDRVAGTSPTTAVTRLIAPRLIAPRLVTYSTR